MSPDISVPADLADVHRKRRHESPDMAAFLRRSLMALARRAGEGDEEALQALAELSGWMPTVLGAGVAGYRSRGFSWAAVGRVLGITRQGAEQRFSGATVDPAHGPRCACGQNQCPRNQGVLPC